MHGRPGSIQGSGITLVQLWPLTRQPDRPVSAVVPDYALCLAGGVSQLSSVFYVLAVIVLFAKAVDR